jgi:hypothetical protein
MLLRWMSSRSESWRSESWRSESWQAGQWRGPELESQAAFTATLSIASLAPAMTAAPSDREPQPAKTA